MGRQHRAAVREQYRQERGQQPEDRKPCDENRRLGLAERRQKAERGGAREPARQRQQPVVPD